MAKYAKGSIFVKGKLMAQATGIEAEHRSGGQRVETIELGFAGRSPGAKGATVTIDLVVPASGEEEDFVKVMNDDEEIEIVIAGAGKKKIFKGFIDTTRESYRVNTVSARTVVGDCKPAKLSTL